MDTKKPKILLTGFNPFSGFGDNPTQVLMETMAAAPERFPGAVIRTVTLDTSYAAGERKFHERLVEFRPDGVISFGLNFRIDHIALERIAVNVDDAEAADNAGVMRHGDPIARDGPVGYLATNPIEKMKAALEEAGIPVKISNHAGAFLCNHIFYYGSHVIARERMGATMGFIHVPPPPELLETSGERMEEKGMILEGRTGMSMDTIRRAAEICIGVLVEHLSAKER